MIEAEPTIEFFAGLPEVLSNVSLRRNKMTGLRMVMFTFQNLKAIEKFQSFTNEFHGALRLTDSEGVITAEPSSLRFLFGGDEGDELKGVECGFEIEKDDHWDRFMRFMNRYAEANGMGYQDK
ncbi:MAG: photosystem II reaction center protein Psb28 [Snowella sp.]|nr:photosystem II reaction center protein Psb28 [Snowella sp.]